MKSLLVVIFLFVFLNSVLEIYHLPVLLLAFFTFYIFIDIMCHMEVNIPSLNL